MFRLYNGEFLISPASLHFGLNWCSHNCFYCFANLNSPQRRVDGNAAAKVIRYLNADEYTTVESYFLRDGHNILMANDTDPCSKSNADTVKEIVPAMMEAGAKFAFQTKCGDPEVEQLILNHPPTMIYVSLTSDDDELLKRAEPGAPSFRHRVEFMRQAVARGHYVIAGVNPLYPAWWDDFEAAMDEIKAAGVGHVWIGNLHITADQKKNISPARQIEYESEIAFSAKKDYPMGYDYCEDVIAERFKLFGETDKQSIGFWEELGKTSFKGLPTWNDFITFVVRSAEKQGQEKVAVTYEVFEDFIGNPFPPGERSMYSGFVMQFRRTLYDRYTNPKRVKNPVPEPKFKNLEQVLRMYWNSAQYGVRTMVNCDSRVSWPVINGERGIAPSGDDILIISREPTGEHGMPLDGIQFIDYDGTLLGGITNGRS